MGGRVEAPARRCAQACFRAAACRAALGLSTLQEAVRVAVLAYAPPLSGVQRLACDMASYWAARGGDVVYITLGAREAYVFSPHPEVLHIALGGERPDTDTDTRTVGADSEAASGAGASVAEAAGRLIERVAGRARRELARRFAELGVDVVLVFADAGGEALDAVAAARRCRLPVVAVAAADPAAAPARAYHKALRTADWAVAATERVARELQRTEPSPRHVETLPVPILQRVHETCGEAEAGWPQGTEDVKRAPLILAAGSLSPHNGFDLLLRAYARIRTDFPEWGLRIFGDGPEHGRLLALADELDLAHRVDFTGAVEDMPPVYAEAEVFALPSRSEVFALSLLEAMAGGLPAVAFDCPVGPRELVGHRSSGLLVPAGKVDLLAEALAKLITTPRLRRHIGRRARHAVAAHRAEVAMPRWEQLLQKVAMRRGSGTGVLTGAQ